MTLGFAIAMMELLKVHMLASYLALAIGMRLDFATFSLVFLASFVLNRTLSSRRMKIIFKLLANAALALFFLSLFADPEHKIVSVLALASFYARAWWAAGSEIDHEFCVSRFDEGLLAFLLALGIAALVKIENPIPLKSAGPYLAFSMLALGVAQRKKISGKERFSKSHNATLASSILVLGVIAVGVAGIAPLTFLPAQKAGTALGSVFLRLLRLIVDILEWIFKAPKPVSGAIRGAGGDGAAYAERVGEEISASSIFAWVVIGIFCVGALLAAVYFIGLLFRYLMSDSVPRKAKKRRNPRELLADFLRGLKAIAAKVAMFARSTAISVAQRHKSESHAIKAYRRLLACGRMAGMRIQKNETPREYAGKLSAFFPQRSQACSAIVDAVERQTFGDMKTDPSTENSIRVIAKSLKARDYLMARIRLAGSGSKRA